MKWTTKSVLLAAAALTTLLGSSAVAKNPWQTMTFDFGFAPEYVSCLGEDVTSYYWVTARYREVETPSGVYHYFEPWKWEAEYVGQATGRVWFGYGHSGGVWTTAKGEVGQWTSTELARPIVGDGPKLQYHLRFKVTVNANGELKVLYEPPIFLDDVIRCLGPKN